LLAVLERRRLPVGALDVFVNVTGGVRLSSRLPTSPSSPR
jgi:predicted ATP-dependent serine protease